MITKDIKNHLEVSCIHGKYNKTLLHKLILIKSLEICNLAELKGSYELSFYKYKIEEILKSIKNGMVTG